MTGHEYEYAVANYLREQGYYDVEVTQASGDYGIDVLARKGGHRYAVQCKYYSGTVGISAVQEAVAGMAIYGCDRAMVVTNSTFTKAAKELAEANDVVLLSEISGSQSSLPSGCALVICVMCFIFAVCAYCSKWTFPSWKMLAILGVFYLVWFLRPWSAKGRSENSNDTANDAFKQGGKFTQTGDHTGDLDISPIIGVPTKFTVLGIKYCIDNLTDIQKFPLNFSSFEVNGQKYYFNTYFRMCADLYYQKGRVDLGNALISKAQELESHPSYGAYLRSKVKSYTPSVDEDFDPVFLSCNPATSKPWTKEELVNTLERLKEFNQNTFDTLFEIIEKFEDDERTLTASSVCLYANVTRVEATRILYHLVYVGLVQRNGISTEYYFTASKDEIIDSKDAMLASHTPPSDAQPVPDMGLVAKLRSLPKSEPFPSPLPYAQDNSKSAVNEDGYYDMEQFSLEDISVVKQALRNAKNNYPPEYQALGLAMESFGILHEPRYILHEIIVLTYANSKQPLEQLAVGFAYATKGGQYRAEALNYIEQALPFVSADELKKISNVFPLWWIYNTLSDLCEGEGLFDEALDYAYRAAALKSGREAYDYIHLANIYKKINIELALDYYENILLNDSRNPFKRQIEREYEKMTAEALDGYRYEKEPVKRSEQSIEFDTKLRASAMKFINNEV